MNQRADYLFQILDKIGSPLLSAVIETSDPADENAVQHGAQALASLLGKTVQASIDLGQVMDVNPVEVGDDSLRLALAGLSAPLVADQMRKKGGVPDDAHVKRIVSALQTVLTFSDNFTPSENNAKRLEDLPAKGQTVDAHQVSLQYVLAFAPVAHAISVFSFGQVEQKLIADISDKLVRRASGMRQAFLPSLQDEDAQKRAELVILSALTKIYAACHLAQTQKAGGLDDETGGPTLAAVWESFDLQAAMLESLAGSLLPGASAQSAEAASSGSGGGTSPAQAAPQAVNPAAGVPVQTETPPPAQEQPQDQAAAAAAPPAGGNPMAMFAKPKDDGANAAPPAAPPPQAPPPVQPQPETPPQEQQQPPAAPPVQPPPAEGQADEGSGEGSAQGGGSPMSFFKKGE